MDIDLAADFDGWGTLAPGRHRARRPSELVAAIGPHPHAEALGRALAGIAGALRESFPGNLFADLDALAGSLSRRPSAAAIEAAGERIAALHRLYGAATSIRFRYAHDFLYGYDWARWCQREPDARAEVGPYDDAFLGYLEERGHELLVLISKDDTKYPTLRHEQSRNPFSFRRDREAEARLLRALAEEGLIPVAAWELAPSLDFRRPWSALREGRARALGLSV
jgi:hypothetical protein